MRGIVNVALAAALAGCVALPPRAVHRDTVACFEAGGAWESFMIEYVREEARVGTYWCLENRGMMASPDCEDQELRARGSPRLTARSHGLPRRTQD